MANPNLKADLSIRKSLTTTAYEQLEEIIVTAELEPGAILSEATLVAQLGIGRTPIREALQKLEREALIRIMPRKGIEVTDLNPAKQLLMLELRRDLEKLLARSGALRATEEERSAFIVIADAMDETVAAGSDIGSAYQCIISAGGQVTGRGLIHSGRIRQQCTNCFVDCRTPVHSRATLFTNVVDQVQNSQRGIGTELIHGCGRQVFDTKSGKRVIHYKDSSSS